MECGEPLPRSITKSLKNQRNDLAASRQRLKVVNGDVVVEINGEIVALLVQKP